MVLALCQCRLGIRKGIHPACRRSQCLYVDGGDLTAALHIERVPDVTPSTPPSPAAVVYRMFDIPAPAYRRCRVTGRRNAAQLLFLLRMENVMLLQRQQISHVNNANMNWKNSSIMSLQIRIRQARLSSPSGHHPLQRVTGPSSATLHSTMQNEVSLAGTLAPA